jgi:hypothetical protein
MVRKINRAWFNRGKNSCFLSFFFLKSQPKLKFDEKSIESGLETPNFQKREKIEKTVRCLFWGGYNLPNHAL